MHTNGEIHLLTPGEPKEFAEGWEKITETPVREVAEYITDKLICFRNNYYPHDLETFKNFKDLLKECVSNRNQYLPQ